MSISRNRLRGRFESNISSSHHQLKKDFARFFKHDQKILDDLLLVDHGEMDEEKSTIENITTHEKGEK